MELIMITVTITETRPNTTIPFWDEPLDFLQYIQKYNDVRFRTVNGWTYSQDELIRTHVAQFTTMEDFTLFDTDINVEENRNNWNNYNDRVGIIKTKEIS